MFDIFYSGVKPNLFPHEHEAHDIEHARKLSRTRYFWWVNYLTDYTEFNFLWEPVPWQSHQRHAWSSQWQKDAGTYLVPKNGYTDTNYHNDRVLTRLPNETNWRGMGLIDISWHPDPTDPPLIYQFGTQWQKTGGPQYQVPGATDTKYVDQPRIYKTEIDPYWTVPDACDVSTFDFTWHPDATDPPYTYQFGTQHQRTGGPQYQVPGATDIKYVDQISIKTRPQAGFVYVIDHLDHNAELCKQSLPKELSHRVVRYFDNYLDTLKRIAQDAESRDLEYVWIVSSICDYVNFDWTWHPEQWQATMLHVFASDGEKFGDTFFMHVPTFKYRADKCQLLDWYDLNFTGPSVPRHPLPVIKHKFDTHVEAVKLLEFNGPLAIYATEDVVVDQIPTVPLWREKTKTVVPLSKGAGTVVVPKVAIPYIKTQLYDYANIDRTQRHMYTDSLLDIVFIDNSESNAEENWAFLNITTTNNNNRIHRSSGVNGRVAAYQSAARLSTTPWFFAVFAKLRVNGSFDWTWQPDRLQEPKHYIFHAYNPVNGLEYGHQAMIAYNRELVLNNPGVGLDFTLDSAHEVVPVLSGIANYTETPWMAWRTAFRECLKLRGSRDIESQYRLDKWLTVANAVPNAEYSVHGAKDAVEYYDSVEGDFAALQKSYDWAWLASYALIKRNLIPSQ